MKRILFFICVSFFTISTSLDAQDLGLLNEELVRSELDARGFQDVSIDELRSRLTQKGIDVENLDGSQTEALQEALDQIYVDLQTEKDAEKEPTEAEKVQEKQQEKVEEFADKKEDADLDQEIQEDVFEITEEERKRLIYGQDLFLDINLSAYNKNSDVRPSDSYVLGEGDEVIINIIGDESNFSGAFIVENGYIKPFGMESIYLKGLTFSQSRKQLVNKFKKYYRFKNDDFVFSLNFSRNVIINVTGMARRYGSFNLPATNTVFTALAMAKGPSVNGSVRNIKVHRSGSPSKNFDLYEYMMDPSIVEDFFLQNNDYIHIPTKGKVVNIEGAVIRPHKYELKDNENLKKLLFWSGGLNGNAYKKSIRIIRFEDDQEKIITIDLGELERSGRDFPLKNGDKVNIPVIPATYKNFVAIEGEVELPGQYQFNNGMKISDLISMGTPSDLAKLDEAVLFRIVEGDITEPINFNIQEILSNPNSPQNLKLLPKDRIVVFSISEFSIKNATIKLNGAIRNPNNYKYNKNMKLADAVTLSGGLTEDATGMAYIFRRNSDSYEPTDYVRVNIQDAMENRSGSQNIILEPRDSVVVYSYSDISDTPATVAITGAVLKQDTFSYSSQMTLRDLLYLSGGLKLSADQAKIDIYRININSGESTRTQEITIEIDDNYNVIGAEDGEFLLSPYDIVDVRYTPDFELQQNITVKGEVRYPGDYSLIKPNEKLSDVIKRAGGFKETAFKEGITLYRNEGGLGYLVVDVKDVLSNPNSPSNYILKKGDVVTIPKEVNVVSIQGFTNAFENYGGVDTVGTIINVPFHEGKDAKYYIDKYAGGINKDSGGKYSLIKVRQPGGKLNKTKDYGFFKRYPKVQKGAVIIVDAKRKTEEQKDKEKVDWGEVISNTVAQATAILTLVILIQQIQ